MKNHLLILVLLVNSLSIFSQEKKEYVAWDETIEYISKYKDSMIDFHYFMPTMQQEILITQSELKVNISDVNFTYDFNANLKNLKQIRDYKGEGFFMNFGWKKVSILKTNLKHNKIEERKSMHLSFKVNNVATRKDLFKAFNHLVNLNKEN